MGIASNLIKRRQDETYKREQREPLVRDMRLNQDDIMSDDELFDLVTHTRSNDPARQVEARDTINTLLSGVSQSDQDLLRLAILHDMNGDMLAQALGVKSGTARVRLHRALNRLRASLDIQYHIGANQEVNES